MENTTGLLEASIREKWMKEQIELKKKLIIENERKLDFQSINYVGGVDISFIKGTDYACSSLVVLSYPQLEVVYENYKTIKLVQPYIAGFLAFREVYPLLDLWEELKKEKKELIPQVIMVDGNGVLHPHGFGLASHFGVLANIPTIGIGKNLLYVDGLNRENVKKICKDKLKVAGDHVDLVGDSGKVWGRAMRCSNDAKNWIYVSIGHLVDLDLACNIVRISSHKKIPEPIRQADLRSREKIRVMEKNIRNNCCSVNS